MSRSIDIDVVAEGVETDGQLALLALLHEMGCDLAQGYLISRPKDVGEMADWMGQRKS